MSGISIPKKTASPRILCLDGADSRVDDRQKILEDAGFVVMRAQDETDAMEFLGSAAIDVVIVDSRVLNASTAGVVAKIKRWNPHVRIVFVRYKGPVPPIWHELIHVVIDESEFNAKAPWLFEELRNTHFPFFAEWFGAWKLVAFESRGE